MAEARGTGTKKRKMGDRREADASKTKWPNIKPKKNLQITRLKDTDLFTVRFFWSAVSNLCYYYMCCAVIGTMY